MTAVGDGQGVGDPLAWLGGSRGLLGNGQNRFVGNGNPDSVGVAQAAGIDDCELNVQVSGRIRRNKTGLDRLSAAETDRRPADLGPLIGQGVPIRVAVGDDGEASPAFRLTVVGDALRSIDDHSTRRSRHEPVPKVPGQIGGSSHRCSGGEHVVDEHGPGGEGRLQPELR